MRGLPAVGPALLDPDRAADVARTCGRGARLMRSVIQGGLSLSSWRGCVFTRKVPIRTVAPCVPLCVREIASPLPQTSVVPDNHRSARWGVMTAHIREWLCCLRDERLLRGSSDAGRFRRRSAGPVAVTCETTVLMTKFPRRHRLGPHCTSARCRPAVDGHEHGSSILPRGDQIPCNH